MEFAMNSITKTAALAACFAVIAVDATATTESCPILDEVVVDGNAIQLPADAARQVTMMQEHDDRYARVIDMIIEENAKPDWTFSGECTAAADAPTARTGAA